MTTVSRRIDPREGPEVREVPVEQTQFRRAGQIVDAPLTALPEFEMRQVYPGRLMRVLLAMREVALIVWLTLGSVLMILLLTTLVSLADRLGDVGTPGPESTIGCPFGDGECGG